MCGFVEGEGYVGLFVLLVFLEVDGGCIVGEFVVVFDGKFVLVVGDGQVGVFQVIFVEEVVDVEVVDCFSNFQWQVFEFGNVMDG